MAPLLGKILILKIQYQKKTKKQNKTKKTTLKECGEMVNAYVYEGGIFQGQVQVWLILFSFSPLLPLSLLISPSSTIPVNFFPSFFSLSPFFLLFFSFFSPFFSFPTLFFILSFSSLHLIFSSFSPSFLFASFLFLPPSPLFLPSIL